MLRSATGVEFAGYRQTTIQRRIQRRLTVRRLDSLEEYLKDLEKHPGEVQALFGDILIHVTNFFREPESFAALAAQVLPELLKNRGPDDPIRVWVPGCSTGEEAYSLAISLVEFLGDNADGIPIQIFGTDVSEQAIEAATELGVDEVVPWQAERSVVIWRGERAARSRRKWESIILAATKQSRRTRVPLVDEPADQQAVIRRIEEATLALVLHEEARLSLAALELPPSGDVVLIVGPEGGISPSELIAFVDAGAVAVRLGPNVLRSSSAGPAALAVMSAAGRWR